MPDRPLLDKHLKRAARTLAFLALIGAFFIAAKHGAFCDPADLDYCTPSTQGEN